MTGADAHDGRTLVVALYGGPGTGKSSTMASVFAALKWMGYNVEMAPEFAKEKVWEKSFNILGNQIYVFGKQLHTLVRVDGQVSAVITDSPLLLSLIYGKNEVPEFKALVLAVNARFRTRHFFLRRLKAYNPKGRMQSEDEARAIDGEILALLDGNGIKYNVVDAGMDGVDAIVREVVAELGDPNHKKEQAT